MLPLSPPYLAFSDWVGLLVVFLIFGGGGVLAKIVESINRSRVEIAQLRAQQKGSEGLGHEIASLRDEMAALRQQVTDLRDTTTQYDLSIDTNLQRLERRVDQMEQQQRIGA